MPRKLIIDADPGIGDAFAIALATLDPNIDLIGVTASSGCVSG
ncbi:MAG: nucleoside hydrolase, partial [Planctomycetaceae bacterium]|nr:nucleoside hydrolase [Planctomycetaceae bacterium]